jgi:hypothetical protein
MRLIDIFQNAELKIGYLEASPLDKTAESVVVSLQEYPQLRKYCQTK